MLTSCLVASTWMPADWGETDLPLEKRIQGHDQKIEGSWPERTAAQEVAEVHDENDAYTDKSNLEAVAPPSAFSRMG